MSRPTATDEGPEVIQTQALTACDDVPETTNAREPGSALPGATIAAGAPSLPAAEPSTARVVDGRTLRPAPWDPSRAIDEKNVIRSWKKVDPSFDAERAAYAVQLDDDYQWAPAGLKAIAVHAWSNWTRLSRVLDRGGVTRSSRVLTECGLWSDRLQRALDACERANNPKRKKVDPQRAIQDLIAQANRGSK